MRRRVSSTSQRPISVKVTDPNATGNQPKSISFTVYGGSLQGVANLAQDALASRWTTTKLNDRRHKQRLF